MNKSKIIHIMYSLQGYLRLFCSKVNQFYVVKVLENIKLQVFVHSTSFLLKFL